jgi:P-type Cu+ transporter
VLETISKILCYHCGEECDNDNISIDDKIFCCNGCKLVYELLSENNLCQYYEIDKTPGITRKENGIGKKFDFLDNDSLVSKLLDFKNDEYAKVTLFIPNIHCSSCIYLLEHLHKIDENILQSVVDFPKRTISIVYNPENISLRTIAELLTSIGYEPKIELQESGKSQKKPERTLYYKIGIAGFAFGNIMLLSFPEYLASDSSSITLKPIFNFLTVLLSLPVFFYCSSEYFSSAWKSLKYRSINVDVPLSIGILAFYGRSLYEILSKTGPGYMDSFSGLIFFLLIGRIFQKKTYDLINFERDYTSYFPIAVNIKRGLDETSIPLAVVAIGDRIIIRNNEIIPVDSIIAEGAGNIDYSFITGESSCAAKVKGDFVYAGGKQVGGKIEIVASKNVSQSYLTKLWDESSFKSAPKRNIVSISSSISRYFTVAVIVIAAAAGIFWYPHGMDKAMQVVSAVLIIACPCALALSGPFAFGNAMRILSRNQFYIKNTETLEKLNHITAIVFDKTGTMTHQQNAETQFIGEPLESTDLSIIASLTGNSTHPLSRSIAAFIKKKETIAVDKYQESEGRGIEGIVAGKSIRLGSWKYICEVIDPIPALDGDMSPDNRSSRVYVVIDGKYMGFFAVLGNYREGIEVLLKKLKEYFKIFVLSGDTSKDEKYLLTQTGMNDGLYFNQSPFDKLHFIQNLQDRNEVVMMIGDGLNDAGALRQSDVGVSVSENIINFSPASDAILGGESLKNLVRYFEFIRKNILAVKLSFAVSIVYNIFGLYFACLGLMTPLFAAILMPISSITVIVLTVVLTSIFGKVMKLL